MLKNLFYINRNYQVFTYINRLIITTLAPFQGFSFTNTIFVAMPKEPFIKILVLIDYATEFSRRFLSGLIRYSKECGPWVFYRVPFYYKSLSGEAGVIELIKQWEADAVVAQWDFENAEAFKKLNIPIFIQNNRNSDKDFSNITGDYLGTGALAARFFVQRNYKNFAFYGNKGFIWSRERAKGFMQEVEKAKGNYFSYESQSLEGEQWSSGHKELYNWLVSLPKPVALFACDDSFAIQVSEICQLHGIKIPDEISLLGVDNDEIICDLSDPTISSVVLDAEKGGYETGRSIHQVIKSGANKPFEITINAVRFQLRKSTEQYNIKNEDVLDVVKYIRENFASKITIDQLTKLVPLSRRNLEVKFKLEVGMSIYQFILEQRIEYFSQLLLTTRRSLFDLSIECGFNDSANVYRIFKKMKGFTPMEYRQKFSEV